MYSKKQAQIHADEMILKLDNPDGWKTRVWENMGSWHYEIKKGCLSVMPSGYKYFCLLNDDPVYTSGSGYWHTGNRFSNINDAIENQLKVARDFILKCQIIVREIEE